MAYFKIRQWHLDAVTDANCTLFINGVEAKINDICYNGDIFSITSNDGHIFYTIPQEPQPNPRTESASVSCIWYRYSGNYYIPFDVVTDPKVATWVFPELPTEGEWSWSGGIGFPPAYADDIGGDCFFTVTTEQPEPEPEPEPEVAGSNNVYVIDNEILAEINAKRFRRLVPIDGSSAIQIVDYGQFILSVIQIPSSISSDLALEPVPIQLGDFNSEVLAPELATDNLRFDMGSFEVPQIHNNLLDFSGVVCNLHLPFSSSIAVDVDYVVGETLSIEYLIDCYTGVATINLSSSKVGGEVFYTTNTSLGINIPFIGDTWGAPENSNINVGGDNRILKPYLEIISNDAILIDGFFTIPIADEGAISGNTGFIKVEEINLTTSALSDEISEIKHILTSGVIINV